MWFIESDDYKHQYKTNSYRPLCFYYPNAVIYVLTGGVLQAWVLHCRHCRYKYTKQKIIFFLPSMYSVHYIIFIVSMILLWQSGRFLQSVINLIGVVLMCNISGLFSILLCFMVCWVVIYWRYAMRKLYLMLSFYLNQTVWFKIIS